MHLNSNEVIISKANRLVNHYGSRTADVLASELGITIKERNFKTQKGAYLTLARNPFIFLKRDLEEPMRSIVILHEIGHHILHRDQAQTFHEFSIFDMKGNVMEYEANLFAAQVMLPDEEMIDYMKQKFTVAQIAAAMHSDINLVALKATDLSTRGMKLNIPDYKKNFL